MRNLLGRECLYLEKEAGKRRNTSARSDGARIDEST